MGDLSEKKETCCCEHEEAHEHTQKHDHHHEHDHHHHHEHDDCCCDHEEVPARPVDHRYDKTPKQVFVVDNLDCANCAAKIEHKIAELPEVDYAVLTFATKQLQIVTSSKEDILPLLQRTCDLAEEGVVISRKEEGRSAKASEEEESHTRDYVEIGLGVVLFLAGVLLKSLNGTFASVCYIAGYLLLGWEVLFTAGKNLTKGHVFDENFLMSIATIGALAIGDLAEAVGVMLFYRIGELFEDVAVAKSRSQIMDAVDMRPEVVSLVKGDEVTEIPAKDAVVGDIVLVRPGDRIPLDGRVEEGESRLDTSAVTGESVPVAVKAGDEVMSGCVNASGLLKIRVEKELKESMVTRILDSVENAAASKPKIDRFITRFSRVYTPIVVILALGTAIIPSLITGEWHYWIYTAMTFLVISCPCALVLSVPLAFFSGIGAGSKRGILFKGGTAMETLWNTKAVVMDKTGTVTEGNFVVQKVLPSAESGLNETELLKLAAACEMNSTHPIAESIMEAVKERNLEFARADTMQELSGRGVCAQIGAKKVLCGNRRLLEENDIAITETTEYYKTEVLLAADGVYAGAILIDDTIKENAKAAINALKRRHIVTAMLTGDGKESADAVAAETGIDEVYAKLLPEQKLETLKKLREKHGSVMFVGDGINDAPVLAGADVGAAMGSGADAAIEAADVVFMTSDMDAVVQSIDIAAATGRIAKENVGFALAIKLAVMVLGLAGMANMWFAVFADTGVAMLCILNSIRILYTKRK